MINRYTLLNGVPQPSNSFNAEIIMMVKPTVAEVNHICQVADIDPLTFSFRTSAVEVSRYHSVESKLLNDPSILVVYDFISEPPKIEDQLSPVIIVFDNQKVIISTETNSTFDKLTQSAKITSLTDLIVKYTTLCQENLLNALSNYKQDLDYLDHAARTTMNTKNLRRLTDLTREIIFFEHTMNDQSQTIHSFLKSADLKEISQDALTCLTIQQRRLNKAIHIYKDLLTSISGLFTSMMDSNLNNLMKFLDSAGLVLAAAALITGFMGMNVGGLPWKDNHAGFWLTLLVASIVSILIATYLKRKQYNK